ncbi:MAG: hypothetical protein RR554_09385, partial [Vagococcus sp.]|uniref:hypothetical protein n=1 Tax=Vagococcus sp. TaxID=1933889 RepID=UPI00303FDD70
MKKTRKGSSLLLTAVLLCPLTLTATNVFAEDAPAKDGVQISEVKEAADTPVEKADSNAPAEKADAKKTIPIQMLGVNDFHGAIDSKASSLYLEDPLGGKDLKFTNVGRASVLAAHLDQAQKAFA